MKQKMRCIGNLQDARAAHMNWVNSIKLLISGVDIDEKTMTPNMVECAFGKWYYKEAMLFSQHNNELVLRQMESILTEQFDLFAQIYVIYFGNKKSGIAGLFASKKKVSSHEKELAQRHLQELLELSDKMKQKLKLFETVLNTLDDQVFEELGIYDAPDVAMEPVVEKKSEEAYFYGTRGR